MLALLDSILPDLVQTALSAVQSVVGLNSMVTVPFPLGCTVISHLRVGCTALRVSSAYGCDFAVGDGQHVVAHLLEFEDGFHAEIQAQT